MQSVVKFPKRGRRVEHPIKGVAIVWLSRCRRYRIVRFVEFEGGVRRFLAGVKSAAGWSRVESRRVYYRRFSAAARACELHARRRGSF